MNGGATILGSCAFLWNVKDEQLNNIASHGLTAIDYHFFYAQGLESVLIRRPQDCLDFSMNLHAVDYWPMKVYTKGICKVENDR